MNISRFFGNTNREALRQVRLALGPDALIVSNRRINGGVEILAADPTSAPQDSDTVQVSPHNPPPPADVMRHLDAMQGTLESRLDDLLWGNQLKQSSQTATLFQSLLGCGFSTALLRALLTRLPPRLSGRAAHDWVRAELIRNLPVLAHEDDLWSPGLTLALVGPTGVGKTTTIAKLAARAVQRHGPEGVALLTTDTYRIGAFEQLKIYGDLLKVPVKVIRNAQELVSVLQAIPAHVTVLIDNVGVSQRDQYVAEQAAMLSSTSRKVRRLLVLNASSHGNTLDEVARRYSKDGGVPVQGCIITKVDEASSLGAALDTAIRYRLPIHYVTNGQKVPENLAHMVSEVLIDCTIVPEPDINALFSPSQADFAALMSVTDSVAVQPEHNVGTRVEDLLEVLLSGASDAQIPSQSQAFQGACNALEDILPVIEAWDIWHALKVAGKDVDSDITPHIHRMMRAVRTAGHARPGQPVIAVYGDGPLSDAGRHKGMLRTAYLFDNKGDGLVSVAQQLTLPDGWRSSCGAMAPKALSPVQALSMQIMALENVTPDWATVHIFERGTQDMLRELSANKVNWISRIGAVTPVIYDDSLATASAVAKTLTHYSASGNGTQTICLGPDGGVRTGVVLWVALATVKMKMRHHLQSDLQLISVRVVSRDDGRELKHLYALAHMADGQPDAGQFATWLVTAYEARALMRCAGRMCHAFGVQELAASDTPLKTLLAAQSALAARQLLKQPSQVATMVGHLAGTQRLQLSVTCLALHKLFALKMWLDETTASS